MISFKAASVALSVALASVLAGCASEGMARPQGASAPATYANYDPSSLYQPSPNSKPLAVHPPVAVTGESSGMRTLGCNDAPSSQGAAMLSPNARLCP